MWSTRTHCIFAILVFLLMPARFSSAAPIRLGDGVRSLAHRVRRLVDSHQSLKKELGYFVDPNRNRSGTTLAYRLGRLQKTIAAIEKADVADVRVDVRDYALMTALHQSRLTPSVRRHIRRVAKSDARWAQPEDMKQFFQELNKLKESLQPIAGKLGALSDSHFLIGSEEHGEIAYNPNGADAKAKWERLKQALPKKELNEERWPLNDEQLAAVNDYIGAVVSKKINVLDELFNSLAWLEATDTARGTKRYAAAATELLDYALTHLQELSHRPSAMAAREQKRELEFVATIILEDALSSHAIDPSAVMSAISRARDSGHTAALQSAFRRLYRLDDNSVLLLLSAGQIHSLNDPFSHAGQLGRHFLTIKEKIPTGFQGQYMEELYLGFLAQCIGQAQSEHARGELIDGLLKNASVATALYSKTGLRGSKTGAWDLDALAHAYSTAASGSLRMLTDDHTNALLKAAGIKHGARSPRQEPYEAALQSPHVINTHKQFQLLDSHDGKIQ